MSSPWKALEAPLAAERFAIHFGSPGETLPLEGTVQRAEVIETFVKSVPMGRIAAPAEIAETIAWLMSEAAGYITATTLRVGGGR